MCKNWREKGNCKYGDKCLFAHGTNELTKRSTVNGPEPAKPAIDPSKSTTITDDKKPQVSESETKTLQDIKGDHPSTATDKALPQESASTSLDLTISKASLAAATNDKNDSPTEIVTPAFSIT